MSYGPHARIKSLRVPRACIIAYRHADYDRRPRRSFASMLITLLAGPNPYL